MTDLVAERPFALSDTASITAIHQEIMARPFRVVGRGLKGSAWRAYVEATIAPTWALERLAGDLPAGAHVMCSGLGTAALDGGAWLSLFTRLAANPYEYTLLQARTRVSNKIPKLVLSQRRVRHLTRSVHELDEQALEGVDALLVMDESLTRLLEIAQSPQAASFSLPGKALLFSGTCHARLSVIAKALRDMGYGTGPVMQLSPDLREHAFNGWWVRVRRVAGAPPVKLSVVDAGFAHQATEATLVALGAGSPHGSMLWVGRELPVSVVDSDGVEIPGADDRVVVTHSFGGIGLRTGRLLDIQSLPDATQLKPGERVVATDRGQVLSAGLATPFPEFDDGEDVPDNDAWSRFRPYRLKWISDTVVLGIMQAPPVGELADCPSAPSEVAGADPSVADTAAAISVAPAAPLPLPPPPHVLTRSAGLIDAAAHGGAEAVCAQVLGLAESWLAAMGFEDLTHARGVVYLDGREARLERYPGAGFYHVLLSDYTTARSLVSRTIFALQIVGDQVRYVAHHGLVGLPGAAYSSRPAVLPDFLATLATTLDARAPCAPSFLTLSGFPVFVAEGDEAALLDYLAGGERVAAVFVIGVPDEGVIPDGVAEQAQALAVLDGLVSVVAAGPSLCGRITERMGQGRAVSRGLARLYAGKVANKHAATFHPIFELDGGVLPEELPEEVAQHVHRFSVVNHSLAQFEDDVCVKALITARNDLIDRAAGAVGLEGLRPRVEELERELGEARASLADSQRRASDMTSELVALEEDVQLLEHDLESSQAPLLAHIERLREERGEALAGMRRLEHRWSAQWASGDDDEDGGNGDSEPEAAARWVDLPAWAAQNLSDGVVLHPSALRDVSGLSTALLGLTCRALHMLDHYYIPMRRRSSDDEGPRLLFEARAAALGLETTRVGSAISNHRFAAAYRRVFDGKRVTLDIHVKRGVRHDPDGIFRLYFNYDDESGRVLVGHLPTHLENYMS